MQRMLRRLLMPINGLIKKFPKVYQFCNGDTNKFVLFLRKGVYQYEYMETPLLDKKVFTVNCI